MGPRKLPLTPSANRLILASSFKLSRQGDGVAYREPLTDAWPHNGAPLQCLVPSAPWGDDT